MHTVEVEVAPKTTPPPQQKPTTTPEATSTADADADAEADAEADATAEVFPRVNIGGDRKTGFNIFKLHNFIQLHKIMSQRSRQADLKKIQTHLWLILVPKWRKLTFLGST